MSVRMALLVLAALLGAGRVLADMTGSALESAAT